MTDRFSNCDLGDGMGLLLRARRRDLGISQRELATRAEVGPATVGRLETDRLDVRLDLVLAVLAAVGLRIRPEHHDGRRFTLSEDDAEVLDRLDTGGWNRLPAHLAHVRRQGLPLSSFRRREALGNGRILERDDHWVYRRVTTEANGERLCHPGPVEAAASEQPDRSGGHAMYRDLAPWWPLLSPPDDDEAESAYIATALCSAGITVRNVLHLGSAVGRTAAHLDRHFTMTLVDRCPEMLAVSRTLNPGCHHIEGDMRTLRLGERFDAVLVLDAADHLVTEADLRATAATAFAHCRPGGIAVFRPRQLLEDFTTRSVGGGSDAADGRSAHYHSWTWDPDLSDTWVLRSYAFVLRHADGTLELSQYTHRAGLFGRDVWLDALTEAGFEASALEEEPADDAEDGTARTMVLGHRPRS